METRQAAERPVRVVGRLADGVTIEQARAELAAMVSTLTAIPDTERRRPTVVMTLNETRVGRTWQPVPMMMMAAVLVVLLIACSHAASLLLARASARTRELSMRAALGAGRIRLVRQLLVESVITALAAGAVGLGIAAVFVRWFASEVAGAGLPYWTRFTFDLPMVAVVAVMCLGTGILFGLLPAWQMSRANLVEVLSQGGRAGTGPKAQRLTSLLLVGEVALTVILLSSAAALVRSANVVYRADQTIDVAHLWTFRVSLPPAAYDTGDKRSAFYQALDARLAAAPGLASAAIASAAPFNARDGRTIVMDTESPSERNPARTARLVAIGDRYFDTLGLAVLRGRRLEDLDAATRATAALVNERFADRYSPGVDALGRQVLLFNERTPDAPPRRVTIVGIAPALRQSVSNGHTPAVYVPYDTETGNLATIVIRGRPERFAEALRAEVRRLDPDLPLHDLQSLERVSYMSRWVPRLMSTAFSIVAAIATLLAAVGLSSLTAYAASQRTQEIGVRVALGAQRSQVSWLFLRRALTHASIGLAIGLAGSVAVGTVLQSALIEVRANQPVMLAGVALFLLSIALVAALLPAARASRLDPVAALRQE
jgi:predicted permease